jgi:hypothetical protein
MAQTSTSIPLQTLSERTECCSIAGNEIAGNPSHREMMGLQIYVIGCSQTTSDTLDGSTRIFIECAKRWAKSRHEIRVFTCEEGYELFRKYGLSSFNHTVISSSRYEKVNIYLLYLVRAIRLSVRFLRTRQSSHKMIIYSGSDFWPDSFPAWVLKIRFPKAKWIAGFYLFSP